MSNIIENGQQRLPDPDARARAPAEKLAAQTLQESLYSDDRRSPAGAQPRAAGGGPSRHPRRRGRAASRPGPVGEGLATRSCRMAGICSCRAPAHRRDALRRHRVSGKPGPASMARAARVLPQLGSRAAAALKPVRSTAAFSYRHVFYPTAQTPQWATQVEAERTQRPGSLLGRERPGPFLGPLLCPARTAQGPFQARIRSTSR